MKKKIIFIINDIDYFLSHRLPLAKKLRDNYDLILVCPSVSTENRKILKINNIRYMNIFLKKNSLFFLYEIITFFNLILIFLKFRKSIIHLITIKPILYGSIVSRILGIRNVVYSFSGLGYYMHTKSVIKKILIKVLRISVQKNHKFIFHNRSDFNFLKRKKIIKKNNFFFTIGSGVDLKKFFYIKKKKSTFRIGFISRILIDKGIYEFIESFKKVKNRFNIEAIIAGKIVESNPSSVNKNFFLKEIKKNKIKYHGYIKNTNKLINSCDIVILPSYHEGTPKILLEAAACGKSIICSNIAGCRNVVKNNFNGLIVQVKNSKQIANSIIKIYKSNTIREKFKKNNLKLAKKQFSIQKVFETHLKVYEKF